MCPLQMKQEKLNASTIYSCFVRVLKKQTHVRCRHQPESRRSDMRLSSKRWGAPGPPIPLMWHLNMWVSRCIFLSRSKHATALEDLIKAELYAKLFTVCFNFVLTESPIMKLSQDLHTSELSLIRANMILFDKFLKALLEHSHSP